MINKIYTQQELGITCIKPIKNEYFAQLRKRSIYVSNMGRVISTDFQGRGYIRELDLIDTGDGYSLNVRRKDIGSNGERLNKIMAEVFLENDEKCKSVRYLDGNYHNHKLDNLYYYNGKKEKAGKKYPKWDIFECLELFPINFGCIEVRASGIIATTGKSKWIKGERKRRLETMHIVKTTPTPNGYVAEVVDGGGQRSELVMENGSVVFKTSWYSIVTVGKLSHPIVENSDLSLVLNAICKFYLDLMLNETPMELKDVHIDRINYSVASSEETVDLAVAS